MRYHVESGKLYFADRCLGPATSLYISSVEKQEVKEAMSGDGVRFCYLPYGDWIMANDKWVIGVESKKPIDMIRSWKSKRLAKQLRGLVNAVDVPCLAVDFDLFNMDWTYYFDSKEDEKIGLDKLRIDMVKLQMLGVKIFPRPEDREVVGFLAELRRLLLPTSGLLSVLSGSPKIRGTPSMKLLMAIDGVGPTMAKKLLEQFGTAARALGVTAPPPWSTKRITEGRKKALYG